MLLYFRAKSPLCGSGDVEWWHAHTLPSIDFVHSTRYYAMRGNLWWCACCFGEEGHTMQQQKSYVPCQKKMHRCALATPIVGLFAS